MTRSIFVIGHPIGHSLSPAMHNAALKACGIDARYQAIDVSPADLGAWVAWTRSADALGFNVTVPHKEAVVPHLDEVTGDAALVGAVNTVALRPDNHVPATPAPAAQAPAPLPDMARERGSGPRLVGANTDTLGFRRSLAEEAGESLRGQRVLLLGAGGAARAIAAVAIQDGAAELVVANRHVDRAQRLLDDLAPGSQPPCTDAIALDSRSLAERLSQATIVVNATSVGLRSSASPIDPSAMGRGALAVDIVYNPPETAFLRAAAGAGARTLPGLGMLVYQAAAAFQLWTGVDAPVSIMRSAAEHALRAIE